MDPTTTPAAACDAAAVPVTLLGLLLRRATSADGDSSCFAAAGGCGGFLRDYLRRGTNALLWAVLLATTWLLLARLTRLARLWALGARIPGPPNSSSLLSVCRSGGDLTGYLSKLHGNYGSVVKLWLGPSQLLVSVKDTALIKEVLTKAQDKLPLTGQTYRLACGKLDLFVSSFEKVKERRETLVELLNDRFISVATRDCSKIVEIVVGRIDSIMSKGFLDCRSFAQNMGFSLLWAAIFGERFLEWPDMTAYEELLSMVAKEGCFWATYVVPPFWMMGYWRYQSMCARLKLLTRAIVRQSTNKNSLYHQSDQAVYKKSEAIGKNQGHGVACVIDGMGSGSCLQGGAKGQLFSEEELCGNILGLMLHGSSTTAGLISSIVTRLVLDRRLQEQLYAEVTAVCQKSSELEVDNVLKMQFLLATVCESARLMPAGPLLQRCSLTNDLKLKSSTTIPAGAIIVVPLQLVQMDVSIWGDDACKFNPHRFLSKGIDLRGILEAHNDPNGVSLLDGTNMNETFLPFGSGSRACIGQKFAILGISMLIASLLQNYEIMPHPNVVKEVAKGIDDSALVHHLPNLNILLTKRNQ